MLPNAVAFDFSKLPEYANVVKAYQSGQPSQTSLPDITLAAVTAAASAAAAAAAAAVVAAAGKDIEERLQAAPPPSFPFYGLPPAVLRSMSNPAAIQASIQAAISNYIPQYMMAKSNQRNNQNDLDGSNPGQIGMETGGGAYAADRLHRGEACERTGTSEPGRQQRPSQVHGEDGEDSACSRENEMQLKANAHDQEAEGRLASNPGLASTFADVWSKPLHYQAQKQQNSNGSHPMARLLNPYTNWSAPSTQFLNGGITTMPPSSMWHSQPSDPSSLVMAPHKWMGSSALTNNGNGNGNGNGKSVNGSGKSVNGSVKAPGIAGSGNGTSGSGGSRLSGPAAELQQGGAVDAQANPKPASKVAAQQKARPQNHESRKRQDGGERVSSHDDAQQKPEKAMDITSEEPDKRMDHTVQKGSSEAPWSEMLYSMSKQHEEQQQKMPHRENIQRSSMERESKTDMNSGSSGDDGVRSIGRHKDHEHQRGMGGSKDNPEGSGSNPTGNGSSLNGSVHPNSQKNGNGNGHTTNGSSNGTSSKLQSVQGQPTSSSAVTATKNRQDLPPPPPFNTGQHFSRRSGSGKGSGGEEEGGGGNGSGGNGSGGNGSGGNHSTANAPGGTYQNHTFNYYEQPGDVLQTRMPYKSFNDHNDVNHRAEGHACNTEAEVERANVGHHHKRERSSGEDPRSKAAYDILYVEGLSGRKGTVHVGGSCKNNNKTVEKSDEIFEATDAVHMQAMKTAMDALHMVRFYMSGSNSSYLPL